MKFTFKKVIHEGRYRSFEKDQTIIKLNKKEVGYIMEKGYAAFTISFAIKKDKTKEDPADFKWIRLKKIFSSEKEAREFVKENNDKIQKLDLYSFED